jgi:hypothetical protein
LSPDLHSVQVEIGGTAIRLLTDDSDFEAMLLARYGAFVNPAAQTALQIRIRLLPDSVEPADAEAPDVRVTVLNGRWSIQRGDFRSVWDPASGDGFVEQTANPYSIDTVLRIIHTLILARGGGFLLHASSAVRDRRAFLFTGLSGAGKTTIARLAPPDVQLLTDEISYLRPSHPGYTAFGTPFFGELGEAGKNIDAPVAALYFLAKGEANRVDPVPPAEAARLLLRNILFFAEDANLVKLVFQSACDFLQAVPACRLTFVPDARVWELIR